MSISPILLITFNRPDTTSKVLQAIQLAMPKKLYIFRDGPRDEVDVKLCAEVDTLVDSMLNWDCDVRLMRLDSNLGCGRGPYEAMKWAFEYEEKLIILEDDCVPATSFFSYCDYLLDKFCDDSRIWVVSGDNYCEQYPMPNDYVFTRYAHSQGWGTWKRCFLELDLSMKKWDEFNHRMYIKSILPDNEAEFFLRIFKRVVQDTHAKDHVWDFQFGFAVMANNGLGITPRKNLVSNIGYVGTHSSQRNRIHDRNVDHEFSIQTEPSCVVADYWHDRYHFEHHWNANSKRSLLSRMINMTNRIVRGILRRFDHN